MRVVIQVTSGPANGKKMVLAGGQVLKIGRTEWADLALPEDRNMSGVHFAVEADPSGCSVKDLGSRNGTFVNGRRIAAKTALADGDEVRAGETTFSVRVQGEGLSTLRVSQLGPGRVEAPLDGAQSPEAEASPVRQTKTSQPGASPSARPARASGVPPPPESAPSRSGSRPAIGYTLEKCESGLALCRGRVADMPSAELAILLSQSYPAYLIVDFKNLGAPRPAELTAPLYLFDWLDPPAAAIASPVIVSQEEYLDWPTLIEQGWGNDAVVCLFSAQERAPLAEHLRRSVRSKTHAEDARDGVVGICWPSVLAPLLSHYTRDFVTQLMAGIDAVLVELPDLPETWQLYSDGRAVRLLDQSGFAQRSPAGAKG